MKIVEEVKKGSSKWMKADGPRNTEFHWQSGYAGFSVSRSNVAEVQRYIENQEELFRPFRAECLAGLVAHFGGARQPSRGISLISAM
jgi:hypothetical protein